MGYKRRLFTHATEEAIGGVLQKKLFLKISHSPQEKTYARPSF